MAAIAPATRTLGQAVPCIDRDALSPASDSAWPAPLDRFVTLHVTDTPLRDALDRLTEASGVRLSYSPEAIPVDRIVCASLPALPLGDALRALVRAANGGETALSIHPIAAGPDHVVLAPVRVAELRPSPDPILERVIPLESIVVTGDASGLSARGLPFAADVIDARRIGTRDDVGELLSASVPGLWAWASSPADLRVRYASLRGASSFGDSHPKVYLDGIPVADPLALSRIIPETIERIDVIRGPQGAALYGADAIGGVINISTRRGNTEPGAPRLQLRTGAGLISADFSPGSVVSQDHVLTGWFGSPARSATFNLAGGSTGELLPGAGSRYVAFNGSGRSVGAIRILAGTMRIDFASARSGLNPWLGAAGPAEGVSSGRLEHGRGDARSVLQYTFGTTMTFTGIDRWAHTVVAGVDGYRRTGEDPSREIFAIGNAPTTVGGAWRAGDRLSLRATSVFEAVSTPTFAANLTFLGEHSLLREVEPIGRSVVILGEGDAGGVRASNGDFGSMDVVTRYGSTGFAVQANGAYRNRFFLDAGVRFETNDGFGPGSDVQALPMIGGAAVMDGDQLTATFRTAYGKGMRPTHTALREALWPGAHLPAAAYSLPPESQSGVEVGIELEFNDRVTIGLTRFDQRASGLIQVVAAPPSRRLSTGVRPLYLLQNVGEISNTGWEVETSGVLGRVTLDGTFATVDSRVRRLASGYDGDLRAGDRMLEVPAATASLAASWTATRWSASLTASKAWSWINYDHERLAASVAGSAGSPASAVDGARLRGTWREYDGATRINAGTSFVIRPGLNFLLGVENLFDGQRGEPDTLTVVPGRAFSMGLRADF